MELKRTLDGHTAPLTRVAFSPDGQLLASGGEDAKVVLWDSITGEQQRELTWNKGKLFDLIFSWDEGKLLDLAFSPDGSMLATTSDDGKVRLWDVETGAVIHTIRLAKYGGITSDIESISFSADGRMLAGAGGTFGEPARVWDTSTGELKRVFPPAAGRVESVAFSPADGKLLATGSSGGTVFLWKVPD